MIKELEEEIKNLDDEIKSLHDAYMLKLKTCKPRSIIPIMVVSEHSIDELYKRRLKLTSQLFDERLDAINKKYSRRR